MKLFVTFVDFSQTRVPRQVLFRVLSRLGCGALMVEALAATYAVTESIIGSVVINCHIMGEPRFANVLPRFYFICQ